MRPCHVLAGASCLLLVTTMSACGKESGTSARSYDVKAGDSTCAVEEASVPAGRVTFRVENTGSDVTEVYVYGKDGDDFSEVVGEAENIGPGTSQDLTVDLPPGDYEVACKPGMVGDGIRTLLSVT